jgi:hypothetical protein
MPVPPDPIEGRQARPPPPPKIVGGEERYEVEVVFEGPVAATEKKLEPNQTQLQATGLSGCGWASLLMVVVAVARELSQDPTGRNRLQLVATSCPYLATYSSSTTNKFYFTYNLLST